MRLPSASAGSAAAAAAAHPSPSPGAGRGDLLPDTGAPDDPFARVAALRPERTIPDLALEETERTASPVRPAPEPTVASRDPGLLDFGEVDLAGTDIFSDARQSAFGDAGLSPTSALLPPPVEAPPLKPPPAEPAEPLEPPRPSPRPAAPDPEQEVAAEAERSRRRLRAVGVNALSLVALVVLAVVLFQVWRGRQQVAAPSGPAVAVDVSSGTYETASGRPVVVVRGRVEAAEPLRRAEVRVELLDGGRPVATGTGLAGAVPTPEEVHAVVNAADARSLAAGIASRAPDRISAGEALPFAVVVPEPPDDLGGVEVRVTLRTEPMSER